MEEKKTSGQDDNQDEIMELSTDEQSHVGGGHKAQGGGAGKTNARPDSFIKGITAPPLKI